MQQVEGRQQVLVATFAGEDISCGAWFGCSREAAVLAVPECGCGRPVCIPCRDVIIGYQRDPDPGRLQCYRCYGIVPMETIRFEALR